MRYVKLRLSRIAEQLRSMRGQTASLLRPLERLKTSPARCALRLKCVSESDAHSPVPVVLGPSIDVFLNHGKHLPQVFAHRILFADSL